MRLITVHIPDYFLDIIHELVRANRFPNRSDLIRNAIREFIRTEIYSLSREVEVIDSETSKKALQNIIEISRKV